MLGIRRNAPAVVALAVLAVILTAIAALAAPISNGSGPELISDQQDILTNGGGAATLDFRDGDNVQSCLSGVPIVTFTPARNLTPGKPKPVTVSAGQNTACSIVIIVRDESNRVVTNSLIRLTYHAIVKGSADLGTAAP